MPDKQTKSESANTEEYFFPDSEITVKAPTLEEAQKEHDQRVKVLKDIKNAQGEEND